MKLVLLPLFLLLYTHRRRRRRRRRRRLVPPSHSAASLFLLPFFAGDRPPAARSAQATLNELPPPLSRRASKLPHKPLEGCAQACPNDAERSA
eukprot:6177245-Pleurochrysis_carterae.AAC.1